MDSYASTLTQPYTGSISSSPIAADAGVSFLAREVARSKLEASEKRERSFKAGQAGCRSQAHALRLRAHISAALVRELSCRANHNGLQDSLGEFAGEQDGLLIRASFSKVARDKR